MAVWSRTTFQRCSGCILIVLLLSAGIALAADQPRPLRVSNHFPLSWISPAMGTLPVGLPARGTLETRLALDYSALHFDYQNDDWRWLVDMEAIILSMSVACRLTSRWALGVEMPFISMQSGFLDVFLEGYHDTLNVPNYGREKRPANDFAFEIDKRGQSWIRGRSGQFQPTDATVLLHYQFLSEPGRPDSALRTDFDFSGQFSLALQLPTGDVRQGCGSAGVDAGFFLPMRWSGESWSFFLTPGFMLMGPMQTSAAQVNTRHAVNLSAAVSFRRQERWYWLMQIDYHSSPLEHTGIETLDFGALQLSLGVRYRAAAGWMLEWTFSEDLSGAVPDFSVHMAFETVCKLW